jgi:hypothetical protein
MALPGLPKWLGGGNKGVCLDASSPRQSTHPPWFEAYLGAMSVSCEATTCQRPFLFTKASVQT